MANRLIHRRFQRAVGQIAGTGFSKRQLTRVSVISAAPWAIFSMRAKICCASAISGARIRYSTSACAWTTLGETPPVSVMA
jgi:hypothetical protein